MKKSIFLLQYLQGKNCLRNINKNQKKTIMPFYIFQNFFKGKIILPFRMTDICKICEGIKILM